MDSSKSGQKPQNIAVPAARRADGSFSVRKKNPAAGKKFRNPPYFRRPHRGKIFSLTEQMRLSMQKPPMVRAADTRGSSRSMAESTETDLEAV